MTKLRLPSTPPSSRPPTPLPPSAGTAQDDNRNGDSTHRPVNGGRVRRPYPRARRPRRGSGLHAGDDLIEGGAGADILAGNEGADRMFSRTPRWMTRRCETTSRTPARSSTTRIRPRARCTTVDWIVGDLGEDTLVGTASADILFGGGGSDLIVGGAGHDIVDGDDDYRPGALTGVQAPRVSRQAASVLRVERDLRTRLPATSALATRFTAAPVTTSFVRSTATTRFSATTATTRSAATPATIRCSATRQRSNRRWNLMAATGHTDPFR